MSQAQITRGIRLVFLLLTLCGGCAFSPTVPYGPNYYFIDVVECKETDLISDLQIIRCASKIEETLRQRYNNARVARNGGGVIQVITAATSSMLTGVAGANALTAGTILSGISAIMPEVSDVIEAKGRAEAYADGMKSIGNALAVYRTSIVDNSDGNLDFSKLTPAGAALYATLRAAISVVEDRLAGLLPSTEDLRKSRSEIQRFERIQVIPGNVSLKSGEEVTLKIAAGGPVRAASNNGVAKVTEEENGLAVKITAGAFPCGSTTVTLGNSLGVRESVVVRVEPRPAFEVTTLDTPLKEGETTRLTLLGEPDSCAITEARSDQPDVLSAKLLDGKTVELLGVKADKGPIRVWLKNASGRSTSVSISGVIGKTE